jgi:Mrp family chromosome partitioning ATPase
VRDAFSQIQKFKQDNQISDVNGKLLNEQELIDLTTAVNLARIKTRDLKARADQWQKYLNSEHSLQLRPEGLQSGTLERLWSNYADIIKQQGNFRTTLGARHPALLEVETQLKDIRRLIENEMRAHIQSALSEYQIALANEKDLSLRLDQSRARTDNINVLLIKLKELERNAEAEKQIYDRLLKMRDTLGSDSGEGTSARIIASATPAMESSYPKSIPILSISLAVGLFLSAGGVLFKDFIDARSTNPFYAPPHSPLTAFAHVTHPSRMTPHQSIGQAWVVGVPDLRQDEFLSQSNTNGTNSIEHRHGLGLAQFMTASMSQPYSYFTTAIDQARDHLIQSWSRFRSDEVKKILVTSRLTQAGKTNICTNLALRLSLLGLRVIIIDTDSHNSGLAKLITEQSEPNLFSLSGHTRLVYRIRSDAGADISIVPILAQEEQIIRRLQKKESGRMITGFKRNFDVVIIDGPLLTDKPSLEQFTKSVDHVLVVLDGQREDPSQIDMIAEQFKSTKLNLSGFLISKILAG